ncbi:MAG: cytochrome c oxidase subunit II, partial [Chloroflexi bacterium]|nr:cytochrome c oxidase subunit II [Chloroflexota bacterium]
MTTKKMRIDPYEKNWIRLSIVLLVVFAAAITVAGFMMGIQVPSPEERVDPRTVSDSLPWSEPGLRELSDGKYEAYIMSQT